MEYRTDLVNTSMRTAELLEFAIIGLKSEAMSYQDMIGKLTGELQEMYERERQGEGKRGRGKPPVPTACGTCGTSCPSKGAAAKHCPKKRGRPKKVSKSA